MSNYGPFSVILYARIKKLKLFEINEANTFLEKLADYYVRNIKDAEQDERKKEKVKTLVNLLPSPKKLMQLIKFHRQSGRDMVFFKLALDILTFYYKTFEYPLFTSLQKEIFPLTLQLYKSLSNTTIKDITKEITDSVAKKDLTWLIIFKSKKEYINYYKEQIIEYQNLTAGNGIQMYYA